MRGLQTKQSSEFNARFNVGGTLQRKCDCGQHTIAGGQCTACRKENETSLQRSLTGVESDKGHQAVPPIVHEVLQSSGRPLDTETRAFFEPRFGYDFSRVRVHSDESSARSAQAVNALAYTVDHHVVFGAERYRPATSAGRSLLAHELTHVVQQNNNVARKESLTIGAHDDAAEREADATASAILNHQPAPVSPRQVSSLVQRQPDAPAKPAKPVVEECPKTITIPDTVYAAIATAWKKSKHGEDVVTEHGGRVVTDKDGKEVIRTSSGGGGDITFPAEEAGDVTKSTFHTHPYSKSEGSHLGVSFSGVDINSFVGGTWGKTTYVGAGSCIFALDTLNQTKRDACKAVDVKKRWDDAFAKGGGNMQEKVIAAVNTAIVGCGICHYKTCRPDDKSPIPKTATLI